MSESLEIVLLAFSFILSGFYSGSEAALISIPLDRLRRLVENDRKNGAFAFLLQKPHAVMNTILLGNTLVNIFAASLITSIFARHFDNDVLAWSVGVTTILVLIFGEIIPKTFARAKSESLAIPVIRVLQMNYILFYPAIKILTFIIQKVLGKNSQLRGNTITKKDIEYAVSRAEKEQSIDSKQINLLNSILEFPSIKVKDIMVPRNKVVGVNVKSSFLEIVDILQEHGHSRYPVYKKDIDYVQGFLHVKDMALLNGKDREFFNLADHLKPPFFIYEHMKIQAVFDHMNRRKVHLALVKDENGLVVGIVTLEDIMEEIFGDIMDEHDMEKDTVIGSQPCSNNSFSEGDVVSGSISIRDLDNSYDIEISRNDNYSTLSGFLMELLGNHFPEQKQVIFWRGYSFQILKIKDSFIEEVLIVDIREQQEKEKSL